MKLQFIFVISMIFVMFGSLASAQVRHWSTQCYLVDDDVLQSEIEMTGTHWTMTHTAFEQEKCQKAYLQFNLRYKTLTHNGQIDLTTIEASYLILTDEVANALNSIGYCDFHDWKANVLKVVTGKVCSDFQVPALGSVVYSIFELEKKNSQTYLKIGHADSQHDGNSAARRFVQFWSELFLLKP